ncbi:MAG: AAA family ATPase [Phototrophicaceae bacterium]
MTNDRQSPRAVALVGMPGAGKSVCADYLEQKGFYKFRFGQIVVDEVAQRGLPLTPANERIVRESLREAEGINAIAQRALPYLTHALEQHQTIIIDGLYGFGEYKLLNAQLGASMVVLCVTCNRALRYARLTERSERPLTVEEAIERDFREIDHLEKGGPIAIADYTLLNNGGADDLLTSLEELINQLGVAP